MTNTALYETILFDKSKFSCATTPWRLPIGTKMEAARFIFQRHFKDGRQAVLRHLRENVGLSERGAITYYQNLRIEAGLSDAVGARANTLIIEVF